MNPNITTVFFDVGQTLLMPALLESLVFCEEAAKHGVILDPTSVEAKIPSMYELYEELYEQDESFWSDNERSDAIWMAMYKHLSALMGIEAAKRVSIASSVHQRYFLAQSWKTFDDVIPLLDQLKQRGLRMGLISNWGSSLESIIVGMGLSSYFEVILASTVVQLHKPMPEMFALALERMGVSASEAMHVGDHLTADVEGSRVVGLTPALIDRSGKTRVKAPPDTLVFSSLTDLLHY